MRIVIQANDEDYIAFNKAVQFKSDEGRKNVTKYMVLYALIIGVGVLVVLTNLLFYVLKGEGRLSDSVPFIVMVVYFTFALTSFKRRFDKRIRKKVAEYSRQGNSLYDPEATIDFTDEMIMEYTPKSTTRREWTDIKSIIADDEHFFLMLGPMKGFIVPFRCLGSEINTFMPYVQQKTGLGVIK